MVQSCLHLISSSFIVLLHSQSELGALFGPRKRNSFPSYVKEELWWPQFPISKIYREQCGWQWWMPITSLPQCLRVQESQKNHFSYFSSYILLFTRGGSRVLSF